MEASSGLPTAGIAGSAGALGLFPSQEDTTSCNDTDVAPSHVAAKTSTLGRVAPLSYRQRNAERARQRRMEIKKEVAEPASAPKAVWPDQAKAKAAWDLVSTPMSTSIRAACRQWRVDRKWCQRLLIVAASKAHENEMAAFERLLQSVAAAKTAGSAEPLGFILLRAYDETPRRLRTQSLTPPGEVETATDTAKMMAGKLDFALVLRTPSRPLKREGESSPLATATHEQQGSPPAHTHTSTHIIHGALPTRLVAMADQTANVVVECLQKAFALPAACEKVLAATQPTVIVLRNTDLHRSYPCAERALAKSFQQRLREFCQLQGDEAPGTSCTLGPQHASSGFRCSMHRVQTAEKAMLALDSAAEAFLMNFTLSLRQTDSLRKFRRSVARWCVDPRVLVVKRGNPPAEVTQWRNRLGALLFSGPQDTAKIRRKLCWDLLVNGDARRRGTIEHWCAGETCCPGGRAELESRMLGPCGVMSLLAPPPPLWPRKSWAGQAEVASHCLLLELCGGLISRNFKVLADAADERSASIASRLADLESSRVAGPHDCQASEAAPDCSQGAAVTAALRAHQLATEAGRQCHNTLRFLGEADSLRRLLALRALLEPFRELKSEVLQRSGGDWELEQQCLALVGGRQYTVPAAACGREVSRAQASLTELLLDMSSDAWCLTGVRGANKEESQRRWRMAARGGAALHRMMTMELQTYPWRLLKLILCDGEAGAAEFEADARSCDRLCFLDPLAALHWQKFPSVPELVGAESVAHLQAIAIIAKDNISHIEREHAAGRREAGTREQTHLELLCDSSAAHVLRKIRAKDSGVAFSHAAPAAARRCPPWNPASKGRGVRRRRRQPDNGARESKNQKRRRVDRFNAWVSVHVSGRLVSAGDRVQYRASMVDPAQRARFDALAAVLTAARQGARKRPARPGEHTLRRLREDAKRTRRPWNPREARVSVQKERVWRFHMVSATRRSELRKRRVREREERHKQHACITEFRKDKDATLRGLGFPQAVMDDLFPEPHSVHGLGEGATSPFASRCYAWRPRDATANSLYDDLPGAMQHESLQRVTAWQREHLVLTGGAQYQVPREAQWERTQRMCVKHRRCLCTVAGAPFLAMAAALSSAISRFMRISRARKPTPLKSEERWLVEAGCVVLELCSPKEHFWLLLAHPSFEAGGLPVFLHVRPSHEAGPAASQAVDGDPAASQVAGGDPGVSQVAAGEPAPSRAVGGQGTIRVEAVTARTQEGSLVGRWVAGMDVLEELDLRTEWRTCFWSVVGGDSSLCALTLLAQSKNELFWRGALDIDRAEKKPRCRPPSETEGSEEEDELEDGNHATDAEVACRSDKSEELAGEAQGDADIDPFAAKAKRQKRGVTFNCVASRRAGHEALIFLLTHRPGNGRKRAGFQATRQISSSIRMASPTGYRADEQCKSPGTPLRTKRRQ